MGPEDIVYYILKEVWNEANFDKLGSLIDNEMKLHIREKSITTNAKDLINIVNNWHDIFPDLHYVIHHIIVEEDLVAVNCTLKGTPTKPWKGYEPTGQSISVPHAFFFKFTDNRLVDVWEINDFSVVDKQLME